MDERWEKRGKIETPSLKRRPSDCVREHGIFFSYEAGETVAAGKFPLHSGENHFVFTRRDIPHWDCEFPRKLPARSKTKNLSDETKNKLLYENAKSLFAICVKL